MAPPAFSLPSAFSAGRPVCRVDGPHGTGRPADDQESRSTGRRTAISLTGMDITIHSSFLPQDDPEAALAFYRDTLGFELRNDVGYGGMRWLTVGPAGQPDVSIVLYP